MLFQFSKTLQKFQKALLGNFPKSSKQLEEIWLGVQFVDGQFVTLVQM